MLFKFKQKRPYTSAYKCLIL